MLASDLPDGLALVRKRLVAATERRTATKRLGFAARDSRRPVGPRRPCRRRHPGSRATFAEPRVAGHGTGSGTPGDRAAAGRGRAAAAAANGLARARPRRVAWQPGGHSRARRPGRARSGPWSRPMPTATARSRSRSPSRRPAPTGSASRPSTRPWSCARAACGRRSSCSIRCRRAWAVDAARLGVAVAVGDGAGVTEIVRAAEGIDPARPLAVELEVETGLGRGGFAETELVAAARALAGAPGHRPDRAVDPFPGRRGRGEHGRPGGTVRSRGPRPDRGRDRPAAAPCRGERRPDDR